MMPDTPHTIGDLIAQSVPPPGLSSADMERVGQAIAQATTHSTTKPDAQQADTAQEAQEGAALKHDGQVPGAATSAAPEISQSASADAIERVRRRVSDETHSLNQRFATPWNAR